ncbi:DOPA 4,5-dioxygenase [Wickerhamomyces ciferrii]|uniref:DOPA 4,5-dioxygenase n=1 Tax=Wickerhamomyces ciferrii (strain ATCC 14091 / BCRC 22168 / CBS 111 / JCM 3599 / NBRC 0793 / NRRL Y-1031 F-60-10) TaxID=1206466 RepID=K0KJP8_WICCF|nr:DOPA 4,5-dioxygenase [Wickerhamomyces ciferrii]CCH42362.1 DOPA 4,5-dioxygenase [Wickerhamomyces ciferrii]
MASFHYNITSYDFHTYFKLDDPVQVQYAKDFKVSITNEFHNELNQGSMRIFKTFNQSIGPHPNDYGMFESDTRSPETFLKILNYYQKKHGNLSVLIHPRSDESDLIDHTKNALWLGEKLPLKTEFLKGL